MDPDSLDVRSSVMNFLMDSQDEQSDLETSYVPNGSHKGDWRAVKARVESQARSHLKIPPTENKDMPEVLRLWSKSFKRTKQKIVVSNLQEQFAEWHSLLQNQFHLAFYGVGSMKELVEHFIFEKISPVHPTIILNGYFPSLGLKDVLQTISNKVVQGYYGDTDVPSSTQARLTWLRRYFMDSGKSLVLVIHSLDSLIQLNGAVWQAISEQLAVAPANIKLVVTVDHYFAPVSIPASQPFLWIACPTGLPYDKELAFRGVHRASSSSSTQHLDPEKAEAACLATLKAFSQRAILIFCMFASLALRDDCPPSGVSFDLLLEKVRLAEAIDFKSFETFLNHFQGHQLVLRDLKAQSITTNIARATLQKVLDLYAELWVLYAADLM